MTSLYKNLLQAYLNSETLSNRLQFFIEHRQSLIKNISHNDEKYNFYCGEINAYKICIDMLNDLIKQINLNS